MSPVQHLLAPAKLTRGLRVVGVRDDGYHLLEAEMVALDLSDEIELEDEAEGFEVIDEVAFTGEGPAPVTVPSGGDNLVLKALSAVGRRARVRLTKRIPSGAGLGGGSSDAAAVLRWANRSDPGTAVRLGADVPFCLVGGRALVTGIGELVEPLGFEDFTVVLVAPALAVSTPEVYRAWDALGAPRGEHGNDLEPAALAVEPQLSWWCDFIAGVVGERPRLAGSGGTWYLERGLEEAGALASELVTAVRAEKARALVTVASSLRAG